MNRYYRLSLEALEDRLAPALATHLVFTTSAQTILVGQPSGLITVQLQDQNNQPVQAGPGGVVLDLFGLSGGATFLDSTGNPLPNPNGPSITIPQGSSSVSFEYENVVVGPAVFFANSTGLTSATQQETMTASLVVTNGNDLGPGSLRDAFLHVAPGDTIGFDRSVGFVQLSSPLPQISVNLSIVGSVALDANGIAPGQSPFNVLSAVAVTLSGFQLNDSPGSAIANSGNLTINGLAFNSGTAAAVENVGTLTVSNCSFIANTAAAAGLVAGIDNNGGAVSITGSSFVQNTGTTIRNQGGTLSITDSQVTSNQGIAIDNSGTLTLTRVTIGNNNGGGIDGEGGAVTVSDSTIAFNQASPTSQPSAGGIAIYAGTLVIANSTVADNASDNTNPSGGGIYAGGTSATIFDTIVANNNTFAQIPIDVGGAFTSLGHNLIGAANNQSTGFVASDIVGTGANPVDPKLDTALRANGGPTTTLAILPGSPAIDAGDNTNAPAVDQRGLPRIVNGSIDVGAYEFQIVISPSPLDLDPAQVGRSYSLALSAAYGTAPYTFAITAGALPPGVSFATNGMFSGTPTAGGTFSFTVTATDSSPGQAYSGSQSYMLVVGAATIFTSPTLAGDPVNIAYSQQLTASDGTAPYGNFTVTAGQLPPGITLSPTGLLSGTPTQGGVFLFTVAATDSSGGTGPYTGGNQIALVVTLPGFSFDGQSGTLTITGSAPTNTFNYSQANTVDATGDVITTATYTINGVTMSLPSSIVDQVNVTAQGNNNTAILLVDDSYVGSDGLTRHFAENVVLAGYGTSLGSMRLTGFPTIYAYVSNYDSGELDGIAGGENIFVSAGSYSYVTGHGEFWLISGAGSILSFSTGPSDQAWHYDAAGGLDAFVASGNAYSYMSGTDAAGNSFFNEAISYHVSYGISTHGNAIAYLIDSPGNDVFFGTTAYSYLSGSDSAGSLFNVAEGFSLIYGESFVGGTDFAYNYDPSHNILNSRWILLT